MLVGTHLVSKLWASDLNQALECTELIRQVLEYEAQLGHNRTIVLGDFNMDPFEPGLVAASGFHAVSSRRIAQSMARKVQKQSHKFFYNPMWSHFGEHPSGPPGTYFYDKSGNFTLFWHIFDQLLIRPELLPSFRDEALEVVTAIAGQSLLLATGQPDSQYASDHLPILFALDLEEDV